MFSIIQAAGWPIWPIILASIIAVGIIGERLWSLRLSRVSPRDLLPRVLQEYRRSGAHVDTLTRLQVHSPLGKVLVAGLRNMDRPREIMKDAIEEAGRVAAHELGRYLTTLGTIASMSPLMGLFGTLVGMIEIFGSGTPTGNDPVQLAHGISVALYNSAFGILVAVPSIIFYRHFRAKVDELVLEMELQALKLVEVASGARRVNEDVPSHSDQL